MSIKKDLQKLKRIFYLRKKTLKNPSLPNSTLVKVLFFYTEIKIFLLQNAVITFYNFTMITGT